MKKRQIIFIALIAFVSAASAGIFIRYIDDSPDQAVAGLLEVPEAQSSGGLSISYPQNGTIFPPEIAPPTFHWTDSVSDADTWKIMIGLPDADKNTPYISKNNAWKPGKRLWEEMKKQSLGRNLGITIHGLKNDVQVSEATTNISTSADSVSAPIFYRDVPLPFAYALRHLEEIRWRLGDVSSDTLAHVVLENIPVCANCHSFSADGSTFAMDVDAHSYKDAYAISSVKEEMELDDLIHWSDFQDGEATYSLLANLSPSGRYIASTLKDNEFFVTQPDIEYSQLFFPIKGVIAIYDRETEKYISLPGANDSVWCNSNPVWSPDGKYVYFAREKAIPSDESGFITAFQRDSLKYSKLVDDFYSGKREFKYSIYRVPFNEGKGGKAEPVAGASHNNMSNFFPKISPNGEWMVYVQADNFMLLQPDSKLYIVPALGGEPRLMNCNMGNMNSWHSWSPNGKWMVFSSKERGPFTKLYLTHIDENGNDSPPVCLEYFNPEGRAVNIPEFVNIRPRSINLIDPIFLKDEYFAYIKGIETALEGDIDNAFYSFSKAIESNPSNFIFLGSRCYIRMEQGDYKGALEDADKALKLKPDDFKLHNLRGFAYLGLKNPKAALIDFKEGAKLRPEHIEAYKGAGTAMLEMNDFAGAIKYYSKAVKIDPEDIESAHQRGMAKYYNNNYDGAIKDFNTAVKLDPKFHFALLYRGLSKMESGQQAAGCADLKLAAKAGSEIAKDVSAEYCK